MDPIISKYQYNNEKTVGGYSLKEFMDHNQTLYGGGAPSHIVQSSDRFKDLLVPAGFVMQPQGGCSSMTIKPNKILTISDKMFDNIFGNVTKQRKHNKTRKIVKK
jgi:hypothetical protein